jgi:hypothetical protein
VLRLWLAYSCHVLTLFTVLIFGALQSPLCVHSSHSYCTHALHLLHIHTPHSILTQSIRDSYLNWGTFSHRLLQLSNSTTHLYQTLVLHAYPTFTHTINSHNSHSVSWLIDDLYCACGFCPLRPHSLLLHMTDTHSYVFFFLRI